jgi:hypothetical protein
MRDHRNDPPPTADESGRVWVQLHLHATGGVELGNGESLDPGETKLVHESIAQRLVARDLARYADSGAST